MVPPSTTNAQRAVILWKLPEPRTTKGFLICLFKDRRILNGEPVQVTGHAGRSNEPNASCKEVKGVDEATVNAQLEIGRPLRAWTYDNQCRTFTTQVLWNARASDPRIYVRDA